MDKRRSIYARLFGNCNIILVIIMVLIRVQQMRIIGIKAMKFGDMDIKDFFIIPFVLLFFYLILSSVLILPSLGFELFSNEFISWIGVGLCLLGLIILIKFNFFWEKF
jgi:hypothetical protein